MNIPTKNSSLKIVSLNTWGAKAGLNVLRTFLDTHSQTDLFCFQEIWQTSPKMYEPYGLKFGLYGNPRYPFEGTVTDLLTHLQDTLKEFQCYFRPSVFDFYGNAQFVRKNLLLKDEGELFIHMQKGFVDENNLQNHARNLQFVTLLWDRKPLTVVNIHGTAGEQKKDTPARLEQSKRIVEFVKGLNHSCVLCGDFNLAIDTQSINELEKAGLINLIRKYNIASTRSRFYEKPQRHADYVFISEDLKVENFEVLNDEVSDHLPIKIELSL